MDVAWILCFTLPAALVAAVYLKLREAGCERIALPLASLASGMFLRTLSVSLILRVALELLPGRGLREPWWYPIPATLGGPAITPLIPFIAEYWVPGLIGPLVHPALLLIIAALTHLGGHDLEPLVRPLRVRRPPGCRRLPGGMPDRIDRRGWRAPRQAG